MRAAELLSRLGARLGNWNDRVNAGDTRADQTRRWRLLNRLASRLYVLPDKRKRR